MFSFGVLGVVCCAPPCRGGGTFIVAFCASLACHFHATVGGMGREEGQLSGIIVVHCPSGLNSSSARHAHCTVPALQTIQRKDQEKEKKERKLWRVGPTLSDLFKSNRFWAILTCLGLICSGKCRFGPTRRRRVGPRTDAPMGGGTKLGRVEPRMWSPEGGGPKISRFFSSFRHIFLSFLSLGCLWALNARLSS